MCVLSKLDFYGDTAQTEAILFGFASFDRKTFGRQTFGRQRRRRVYQITAVLTIQIVKKHFGQMSVKQMTGS